MRVVAHVSDLHFGRVDAEVARGLVADLRRARPDLVVVSGDLTQRARTAEFEAARAFLDSLPAPWLAVPGNHDIPLGDLGWRIARPLARYRRHVSTQASPSFEDEEIAVLGLNTARPFVWKEGWISREQIAVIEDHFGGLPEKTFRILVTHHPFIPPPGAPKTRIVGRAREALGVLERCGAQLMLAGHLHEHYHGDIRGHHETIRRSMLVAQAGTAISTRRRGGQPNEYNLLTLDMPTVHLEARAWDGAGFTLGSVARYDLVAGEWRLQGRARVAEPPTASASTPRPRGGPTPQEG